MLQLRFQQDSARETAEGLIPGHRGVIYGKRMGWEGKLARQKAWRSNREHGLYLFVAIQEHVEGRGVVAHQRIKTCCLSFHRGSD